jgi:hypothetical protein
MYINVLGILGTILVVSILICNTGNLNIQVPREKEMLLHYLQACPSLRSGVLRRDTCTCNFQVGTCTKYSVQVHPVSALGSNQREHT